MIKKIALLFTCLFAMVSMALAQSRVTGSVISADDNEPIVGASILVKGTTVGTISDLDGKFTLTGIPKSAKTLIVSYIGMKTQEVEIKSVVNVVLESDTQVLDDVVVTAMGITREKKALGYAVQDIKADALNQASQMNVGNALQGKISGVQITQAGGAVGASQRILIRGNSSFGSNDPLIVIDGVPMDGSSNTNAGGDGAGTLDMGSGLNDINPEDIENISVLKGGSAALYGMRAGNGVILITTKKGKNNEGKMKVSYDGSFTIDKVYHLPRYQNSYGQGYDGSEYMWKRYMEVGYVPEGTSYQDYSVGNYEGAEDIGAGYVFVDGMGSGFNDGDDESWGPRLDVGLMIPQYNSPVVNGVRQATPWISHPNNIKDYFTTGYSQTHNVSFSQSGEKGNFRASIGYRDQKGTIPNTDQKRYNGTLTSSYNFNKFLSADFTMTYNKTMSDNLIPSGYSSGNPLQSIMQWFGRQVDMKDLKAHWQETTEFGTPYNWINAFHVNPYYTVYNNTNSYDRDRLIAKGSIFIKPTSWLKFEGRVGYDYYNSSLFNKVLYSEDCPKGFFNMVKDGRHEVNADFIGYFNKQFINNKLNVDVLAGANYRDMTYNTVELGANQSFGLTVPGLYTPSNIIGSPVTSADNSHIRSNSVYGNISLGWDSQVYAEVSMRNDWSSTIKENFFYPSFSLSWIPTETFKGLKSDVLSYLKVRANLAKVGNATSAYRTGVYYSSPGTTINGVTQYSKPTTLPNANLRPENIDTKEIGVETHFFDSRLRFDVAYYDKTTSDQIMSVEVPRSTGYSYELINAGKIQNRGWEVSISADIIRNPRGFNWTSTLNWSKDNSKILELAEGLDTYTITSSWSCYNYAKVGESWGTLYGTGFTYNDKGELLIGSNGRPVSTAGKKIGDVTPDWLAGWNNEFSYKNISFGFLLDYRKGGDFFSVSQSFGAQTGIFDFTAANGIRENGVIVGQDVLKDKICVKQDGTPNDIRISAQSYYSTYYSLKEQAILDGSYLKLREMHLSYTFPKKLLAKTKLLSDAKVSLVASNVAILWLSSRNEAKIDPESTLGAGNSSVGFESNSVPPTRSIGLKLNMTF